MSIEKVALIAMVSLLGGIIGAAAIYEHRHPCLSYVTRTILVPELTTFTDFNGGTANAASGGFSIPMTTPEHYETEVVCAERRK